MPVVQQEIWDTVLGKASQQQGRATRARQRCTSVMHDSRNELTTTPGCLHCRQVQKWSQAITMWQQEQPAALIWADAGSLEVNLQALLKMQV